MIKNLTSKHPYSSAIVAALICTFLTAVGAAISQIAELSGTASYLMMGASVICSLLVGFLLVVRSGQSLAYFGIQRPSAGSLRSIWFFAPLILMEIIPFVVFDTSFYEPATFYIVLALFTILVGLNEELFFRGLVFGFLKKKGTKAAIIGSSLIFGILHSVNALSGKHLWAVLIQIAFAFLVGLVLVLIVVITRSILAGVIWHAVHNFISYTTESTLDTTALICISIQVLLLIIYAIILWRAARKLR